MARYGRSRGVAVVVCVVLAVAGTAIADDDAEAQARKHFKLGSALHDMGKYDEAIAEYLRAWELSKKPLLLFNVAQAYRLAGDAPKAIEYYERYLELESTGVEADLARKYVGELSAKLEAEKRAAAEAEAARRAEEERRREEARRAEAERARRAQEDARARENDASSTPSSRPASAWRPEGSTRDTVDRGRGLRFAGFASAGLGVALVGTGIAFGAKAQRLADDLSEERPGEPWTEEELAKENDGEAANRNMIVLTVAGGAAVVTGAALVVIGYKRKSTERHVAVSPSVSPGWAGFTLAGRF